MGKTWQNSTPEEYKYENLEYLAKNCILQAEPLTYKINLNNPSSSINISTKVSSIGGKYYVRWGDAFDYIVEVPISGDFAYIGGHTYQDAGEYTVEIWSIPITIGDVTSLGETTLDGTADIISWGYGSYINNVGYPSSVDLEEVGSIVEDSHQTFKHLSKFEHHGKRLTVIPPKLFQYAEELESSSFRGSSIKVFPSNLYRATIQTDFTGVCEDCLELETVEDNAFASNNGSIHADIIQYYSGDYPATRCMKCFKEGNMQRALTDCKDVKVNAGYYVKGYKPGEPYKPDKKVGISYISPNAK